MLLTRGLIVAVCLCALRAEAMEHVWLIGGGQNRDNSQVQIEQNVIWTSQVLRTLLGERQLHIYFTDGRDPGEDIVELRPDVDPRLEPLVRVYERRSFEAYLYRNHRVPGVEGGTDRGSLVPQLENSLRKLRSGDQALLVFYGHGSKPDREMAEHRIWLWNNTWLGVRHIEDILSQAPVGVTVRLMFLQCYSGGFSRAVQMHDGSRCGFFSTSAELQSEGCSLMNDPGDYRDYATYFLAALTGWTRGNQPLPRNPDLNRDGRVSPFEAHLYVFAESRGTDIPVSSSEDFLEQWSRRGMSTYTDRDWQQLPRNIYGNIARDLAHKHGIAGDSLFGEIWKRREASSMQRDAEREQMIRSGRIKRLRAEIALDVEKRSPGAGERVRQFGISGGRLAEIATWIRAHARYSELVSLQNHEQAYWQQAIRSQERDAQLDRLSRVWQLAHWLRHLESDATEGEKSRYRKLLQCETLPLGQRNP